MSFIHISTCLSPVFHIAGVMSFIRDIVSFIELRGRSIGGFCRQSPMRNYSWANFLYGDMFYVHYFKPGINRRPTVAVRLTDAVQIVNWSNNLLNTSCLALSLFCFLTSQNAARFFDYRAQCLRTVLLAAHIRKIALREGDFSYVCGQG